MKLSQDSKKFKFNQNIERVLFEGINMDKTIRIFISRGLDLVVFNATKKELKELIGNLSELEKGLKDDR